MTTYFIDYDLALQQVHAAIENDNVTATLCQNERAIAELYAEYVILANDFRWSFNNDYLYIKRMENCLKIDRCLYKLLFSQCKNPIKLLLYQYIILLMFLYT